MADSVFATRRRMRRLARRFSEFGDFVWNSSQPYPWDVWAADSDHLRCEAGRVILDAMIGGYLIIESTANNKGAYDAMLDHLYWAKHEGDEVPGRFDALFDRICFIEQIGPDARTSAYDLHLRAWDEDDPNRELLDAHAFAEAQYSQREALLFLAERLSSPNSNPNNSVKSRQKKALKNRPKRKSPRVSRNQLIINVSALEVTYGRTRLAINSHADFQVLNALLQAGSNVVAYAELLRAVKPNELSSSVEAMTTAPQEIKDAVGHIKKAFALAQCSHRIQAIRGIGYQLRSPDD